MIVDARVLLVGGPKVAWFQDTSYLYDAAVLLTDTVAVGGCLAGGKKKIVFGTSPKMSTYLLAWVSGALLHLHGGGGGGGGIGGVDGA